MVIDKIKAKKAKTKAKAKARKAAKNAQKTEANFDLNLPDDFYDSSDDGSVVTVVPKTPATYNRKDPAEIPIQKLNNSQHCSL